MVGAMSKNAILVLVAVLLALALGATVALAAPGDLDSSFDGDGTRTIDYGGVDIASDVLVQPDGKIVMAGYGGPQRRLHGHAAQPRRLVRPELRRRAARAASTSAGSTTGYAAALQADGKIVVAGSHRRSAATATSRWRA